jgi:hypothetical protein
MYNDPSQRNKNESTRRLAISNLTHMVSQGKQIIFFSAVYSHIIKLTYLDPATTAPTI